MHPLARVFHLLFLIAGLVLLVVGWVFQDDERPQRNVRLEWTCVADTSSNGQRCETQGPMNHTVASGAANSGAVIAVGGVGLIAASVSVAVAGRRSERPSFPTQPPAQSQPYGAAPPQMPQGQPQHYRQ